MVQQSQTGNRRDPQEHNLVGGLGGGFYILADGFPADPLQHRFEAAGEDFVRTQGNILSGYKLGEHIQHPHSPQQMQQGKTMKKVKPCQNVVGRKVCQHQKGSPKQDHTAANQSNNIFLSDIRNRRL